MDKLIELFQMETSEIEALYKDYMLESRQSLFLIPNQKTDVSAFKGSDVIMMFHMSDLILYCERVILPSTHSVRDIEEKFNAVVKNLPPVIHSKVLVYPNEFVELQLYRKEYLEWLEANVQV